MLKVEDSDKADKVVARAEGFHAGEEKFEAGDITVDKKGLRIADVMDNHDRHITYEELKILKSIGSGCSSTVKLAMHKETGELYALKCISLYVKQMRDQLMTELRMLFKSDCEGLIDFYGAVYREGHVAVVLEFMDLGGLDGIIKRAGTVPERVLAAMTYQMLWGLGYLAHERRVHRDVKPANILVNSKGQVKLTDFGISRELATAVLAGTFVGSFKYMSPERMQSQPYSYSSDIWSLGLILIECATGKYPFPESSSHIDYVSIIMDSEPTMLPDDGTFTPECQDFVASCLIKNPNMRPSAMTLLDFPWLALHGCVDLDSSVVIVQEWLDAMGFVDEAHARIAELTGSGK